MPWRFGSGILWARNIHLSEPGAAGCLACGVLGTGLGLTCNDQKPLNYERPSCLIFPPSLRLFVKIDGGGWGGGGKQKSSPE